MIIMKFGGTSVGDAKRINEVVELVKSQINKKPIIVVSAFSGITDTLIKSAKEASKGKVNIKDIEKRHYPVMKELGLDASLIDGELKELKENLQNISTHRETNLKIFDEIMSYGERISAKIVAAYMNKAGIGSQALNSYDIGFVTNSDFGDAEILKETEKNVNNFFKRFQGTAIVTGYIAKDRNGNITTLGRGGSDYTAAIIGAAVNADEIQIWTDANGMMTADPRIVKDAKTIEYVSYDEASELAFLGAKVLHPKTILPAIRKNIPVRILNTYNPSEKGTIILKNAKKKISITSIAYKKKMNVINVHSTKMFQSYGFMEKIFDIFYKEKIPVDMISTSEINVSLTVSEKYDTKSLVEELKKISEVEIRTKRASISVVGAAINFTPGIAGRIFASMGENKINVEMISSGASEINVSFAVKEGDTDKAVRILHKEFFG